VANDVADLCLLHLNVRSIRNKVLDVHNYLCSVNMPDIFIATEVWLRKDEVILKGYSPAGYTPVAYFNRVDMQGGGSAIYVKNICAFNYEVFKTPHAAELSFECCGIISNTGSEKTIILGIYRCPHSDMYEFLDKLDATISDIFVEHGFNCHLFISGDFNINFYDNSTVKSALCDLFESYGLTLNYNEPTHVLNDTSTLIDYLVCNKQCNDYECVVNIANVSDHYAQILKINKNLLGLCEIPIIYVTKRVFSEQNINTFLSLLQYQSWSEVLDAVEDVNVKYDAFLNIYMKLFNRAFPLRIFKQNSPSSVKLPEPLRDFSNYLNNWFAKCKRQNVPVPTEYVAQKERLKNMLIHNEINHNDTKIKNSKCMGNIKDNLVYNQ